MKHWKKVEEELPKEGINVLCAVEIISNTNTLCFGHMHKGTWILYDNHGGSKVLQWMYIPEE